MTLVLEQYKIQTSCKQQPAYLRMFFLIFLLWDATGTKIIHFTFNLYIALLLCDNDQGQWIIMQSGGQYKKIFDHIMLWPTHYNQPWNSAI